LFFLKKKLLLSISFVGRSPAKQKDHPLAKNISDPYFRDKANTKKNKKTLFAKG